LCDATHFLLWYSTIYSKQTQAVNTEAMTQLQKGQEKELNE